MVSLPEGVNTIIEMTEGKALFTSIDTYELRYFVDNDQFVLSTTNFTLERVRRGMRESLGLEVRNALYAALESSTAKFAAQREANCPHLRLEIAGDNYVCMTCETTMFKTLGKEK